MSTAIPTVNPKVKGHGWGSGAGLLGFEPHSGLSASVSPSVKWDNEGTWLRGETAALGRCLAHSECCVDGTYWLAAERHSLHS